MRDNLHSGLQNNTVIHDEPAARFVQLAQLHKALEAPVVLSLPKFVAAIAAVALAGIGLVAYTESEVREAAPARV